jgi:hypothetical protein
MTDCGSTGGPRPSTVKEDLVAAGSVSDSAAADLRRAMRLISALTGMTTAEIEDLSSTHFQSLKDRLIR